MLDDYVMECTKATPLPTTGTRIDAQYADLVSIAKVMPDTGGKPHGASALLDHHVRRGRVAGWKWPASKCRVRR